MLKGFVVTPLALFGLGPWEVVIIAAAALLLFGKRLPEVAKSAGRAVVQFKKGLRDVEDEIESTDEEEKGKTEPEEPPKSKEP